MFNFKVKQSNFYTNYLFFRNIPGLFNIIEVCIKKIQCIVIIFPARFIGGQCIGGFCNTFRVVHPGGKCQSPIRIIFQEIYICIAQ